MGAIFDWIDVGDAFRLAISPRPPGGQRLDSVLKVLRGEGVDILVSLQPEAEARACGLEREADAAATAGMTFLRHPIVDHGIPSDPAATIAFADELLAHLRGGRSVLAHCYAGIGRSGLLAILVLMRDGYEYDEAAYRTAAARQLTVPETSEQRAWLRAHGGP